MDKHKLDKLRKDIRQLIHQDMVNPGNISTKQFERLIGQMVHVSQTAYAAWSFYKRALQMKNDKNFDGKLTEEFKHDSWFWLYKFEKYDGKAIVVDRPQLSTKYWSTDAYIKHRIMER